MKSLLLLFLTLSLSCPVFAVENLPPTTTRPLMLLNSTRISDLQAKKTANTDSWQWVLNRMTAFTTDPPWNKGKMALAFIEGYKATGTTSYRDRAIELLWDYYFGSNAVFDYKGRNQFRWYARFGLLGYDWLYNDLTSSQKIEAQARITTWADYWVGYINDHGYTDSKTVSTDSDEVTSLTLNLLMMGITLHGDDTTRTATLLETADAMLRNIVVDYYTQDLMAGGLWGEGSHYSSYTVQFLFLSYLINKETRGISYPNNYIDKVLKTNIYMTSPDLNTMYTYGDLEGNSAVWYNAIGRDSSANMHLIGLGASENSEVKEVSRDFLKHITDLTTVTDYGQWWFLFGDLDTATSSTPSSNGWLTRFSTGTTRGMLFAAARTGWGTTDTAIWARNSTFKVDHTQFDALDFSIMRGGDWMTREKVGYGGGPATDTISHNTILIENADDGNSNPTYRPLGTGTLYTDSGSGWDFFVMDATDIYNMSGYYTERYVDLVKRNILFLHSGWTIVYDQVNISQDTDCTWTGSGSAFNQQCNPREKTWLMHFVGKPTESNGVWSDTEGSSKIFWKVSTPSMTSTLVDEASLWSAATQNQIPDNQRTYHVASVLSTDTDTANVIQLIYTGASSVSSMPANSTLTVTGGDGVKVGSSVVVFAADNASYTVDATIHYIANLPVNTDITITRAGKTIVDKQDSGDAGVVEFTATSGSAEYVVTVGNSNLVLPPHLRSF